MVNGWFVIDVVVQVFVDDVCSLFVKLIDGLLFVGVQVVCLLVVVMMDWLLFGDVLGGFIVDQDVELCLSGEGGVIVCYVGYVLEVNDMCWYIEVGK